MNDQVISRTAHPSVHLFADLSNLIGGARLLAPEEGDHPLAVRIHAERLRDVLARGRPIGSATIIVNARPDSGVARRFSGTGWDVIPVEPGRYTGREQAGDAELQNAVVAMLASDARSTVVVATGDGAPSSHGLGFVGTLRLAARTGCRVEVVSWSPTLSRRLRDWIERNGHLYLLDPVYRVLTFAEYARSVEPRLRLAPESEPPRPTEAA